MNQVINRKESRIETRYPGGMPGVVHHALWPARVVLVIFSTAAVLVIFSLSMTLHAIRKMLALIPGVSIASQWCVDWYHRQIDRLGRRVLVDPRDEPILAAVISLTATAVVVFIAQLAIYPEQGVNYYLVAAFYAFVFGPKLRGYARSFSSLHQEGHRNGLKGRSPYQELCGSSFFYAWLCVWSGLIPHAVGHVQNHHRENTSPLDAFGSARYNHANLWHFFRYMTRDVIYQQFMVTPYLYFKQHGRHKQAMIMIKGNIIYFALLVPLWIYSWQLALAYMLIPWGASNFISGLIHWSQHMFYGGRADSRNYVTNTTTMLEKPVNFLNEGYHLCHHYRSGLHWTENPRIFEEMREEMKAAEAMVFRDLGVVDMFLFVTVFRAFGYVSSKLETWEPMTPAEKKAYLKKRLMPAPDFCTPKQLKKINYEAVPA